MRKVEDYDAYKRKFNQVYNEKFKLSHVINLPDPVVDDPLQPTKGTNNHFFIQRDKFEKKTDNSRQIRPKTVEIRKIVYPDKFINRRTRIEPDTSTNRRKSYGKWFIPPEKWKLSLDNFLRKST